MENIYLTSKYNLIYVYSVPLETHRGLLKIGQTHFSSDKSIEELEKNYKLLSSFANKRISDQTNTAGIEFKLEHVELAIKKVKKNSQEYYLQSFSDKDIHNVLYKSGYRKTKINGTKATEWFQIDLASVKDAITAYKLGKNVIKYTNNASTTTITLRKEQEEAIKVAQESFKSGKICLWNAKMRFGKTITALELVKRNSKYAKVLIATHRPVVGSGWYEDYKKVFPIEILENFLFKKHKDGSVLYDFDDLRIDKENDQQIEQWVKSKEQFIYFASVQDLRGSKIVGGTFDKNKKVFATKWDLVIIDEAHEGWETPIGKKVKEELTKHSHTKVLYLSGTPFNILDQFDATTTFTWDYTQEQEAKLNWEKEHGDDHNPYDCLPKLHMRVFDIGETFSEFAITELDGKYFSFSEFFRTKQDFDKEEFTFVHEKSVEKFLNLLLGKTGNSHKNMFPFSTEEFRSIFKHTLWMLPGVKEAKALSKMLKRNPVFKEFGIANVAGDGDEEDGYLEALQKVRETIDAYPYTITLSCGKLTTGVTVPEWTGVFMLSGSSKTSPAGYLQTIFRVQSPGTIDGKQKTDAYVFDFAPDRTLKVIAAAAAHTSKTSNKGMKVKLSEEQTRENIERFLSFCPVLEMNTVQTITYDVNFLIKQLKSYYAEKALRTGFEDSSIYNNQLLLTLDDNALKQFENLKKIVGTKNGNTGIDIGITTTGLDKPNVPTTRTKPTKVPLTPEQLEQLRLKREANERRQKAISILRSISIRIPLLIYGANVKVDDQIRVGDLIKLVDDVSWEEFMPKGVTKELFSQYIKYYDEDVFIEAGLRIRRILQQANEQEPTVRVQQLTKLFSWFKNPDKETVLTPWRVVNMHLSQTIGGYCFFSAKTYDKEIDNPIFCPANGVARRVFFPRARILEINSKTGLYPLYMAYSMFRTHPQYKKIDDSKLWKEVLRNNIFVICKTPMALQITKRTLGGFGDFETNVIYIEDLIAKAKDNLKKLNIEISNQFGFGGNEMKFDAIVGNPPYQEVVNERSEQPPIYHLFYDIAFALSEKVTLITPARFLFNAGKTPKIWNKKMLSDVHFKVVHFEENSRSFFPTVEIKGGVAITYRDTSKNFGGIGVYTKDNKVASILGKIKNKETRYLDSIVFSNTSYKYSANLKKDFPQLFSKTNGGKARLSGGSSRYMASSVFEKVPELFFDKFFKNSIKIIGRKKNQRVEKYIDRKYVVPPSNFNHYKVFLSSSNGSGTFGEALTPPFLGLPNVGATETFLSIGTFFKKDFAENLIKYIKTKFARTMLGTLKVTQGNKNTSVWSNIPLQDFTSNSDIDWTKSIPEIDQQLYKKYNLSQGEIDFIESKVKPME